MGCFAGSQVLLQFALSSAASTSAAPLLSFTVADCARLSHVLSLTKLNAVDPEYMHTLFNGKSADGGLGKKGFDACVRQLVPGSSLSQSQRRCVAAVRV